MKKLKKWAMLLAMVFAILVIPQKMLLVSAAEGDIASGTSDGITWVIDANGKLTISGTGNVSGKVPWYDHLLDIKSAVVDVTEMTITGGLFEGCENLSYVDFSKLDTSKVDYMGEMFVNCRSLTSLDLSGFDTSKVTDMKEMFRGCSNLKSINLSGFNTLEVEVMDDMFSGCSSLTSLDLSGFATPKLYSMPRMFLDCNNLKNIHLDGLNTSEVYDMRDVFSGCSSLTSLDLSGFDTSNVNYMDRMFAGCSSLKSLDLSKFKVQKVYAMPEMFLNCSSLTSLNLMSGFNPTPSSTVEVERLFAGCSNLTSLDLSGFDMYDWSFNELLFEGCNKLDTIYTPSNLRCRIELPGTGWRLPDGTEITELPQNVSTSIMIIRKPSGTTEDDNNSNNGNTDNDGNNGNTGNDGDSNDDQNQNNGNNQGNTGSTGGDNNGGNSGSTSEDQGNQNNFWNENDNHEQTGAISGILEGTGNQADTNLYGKRFITANPTAFKTIMLNWEAVPNAKSYEIFYSTSPDSGFKRLANVKKTSYKFSKATCGVTYYFQMRVCQKGAKSEFGPIAYARTDLTGSTTLQVKKTTYNSIQLKWSKVPGAKKYEIFYADSLGGKWQSLGVKGGTSFTHKKLVTGATYFYQVRPVRDSFKGSWSNGVSTTTTLGDVSRLKVKAASADRMKLSWRKVKGATQYVVLRADSKDGTYEVIDHVNKTSYIDTGLKSGTTYFYKVYAVSGPYRTKETAPVGQTTKIAKK